MTHLLCSQQTGTLSVHPRSDDQPVISVETRQRIQLYLIRKWSLTSLLPANHPYKTTPPLIP